MTTQDEVSKWLNEVSPAGWCVEWEGDDVKWWTVEIDDPPGGWDAVHWIVRLRKNRLAQITWVAERIAHDYSTEELYDHVDHFESADGPMIVLEGLIDKVGFAPHEEGSDANI